MAHAPRVVPAVSERIGFDVAAYERRVREGPCFVCLLGQGDTEYRRANVMIYEDPEVLIFLNRCPTLRGYTLVCPRRHVERVVGDFTEAEYLQLQSWVYRVGRAIEEVVETERVYVLSLGSQQGNRHVHWHVAPLPPRRPLPRTTARRAGDESGNHSHEPGGGGGPGGAHSQEASLGRLGDEKMLPAQLRVGGLDSALATRKLGALAVPDGVRFGGRMLALRAGAQRRALSRMVPPVSDWISRSVS